jgi:hypothetical protein
MRTNSVVTAKEEILQQGGHKMDWMIIIISTGENMKQEIHLVFLGLDWVTYWGIRKDSRPEGHILSMSNRPLAESHILSDSLRHLQRTEPSQKQIHLRRKPVSHKNIPTYSW